MVEFYELCTVIVSLIVLKLCHWSYQWSNPKCNGKLPPGSMGFLIIGETFEFMKPHDTLQYPTFLKERLLRHGPVFRSSLLGSKVIISTDNYLNMEIAKTSKIIAASNSLTRLFGDNNMFLHSKESHNHVRNLTFQLFGSQGLKLRIIGDLDLLARKHIEEGARNGYFDVKETASKRWCHEFMGSSLQDSTTTARSFQLSVGAARTTNKNVQVPRNFTVIKN